MSFEYKLFISIADGDDYPDSGIDFVTKVPISVGDKIFVDFGEYKEIDLTVNYLRHTSEKTTVICDFESNYEDQYLIDFCIMLGEPVDIAYEAPERMKEWENDHVPGFNRISSFEIKRAVQLLGSVFTTMGKYH